MHLVGRNRLELAILIMHQTLSRTFHELSLFRTCVSVLPIRWTMSGDAHPGAIDGWLRSYRHVVGTILLTSTIWCAAFDLHLHFPSVYVQPGPLTRYQFALLGQMRASCLRRCWEIVDCRLTRCAYAPNAPRDGMEHHDVSISHRIHLKCERKNYGNIAKNIVITRKPRNTKYFVTTKNADRYSFDSSY